MLLPFALCPLALCAFAQEAPPETPLGPPTVAFPNVLIVLVDDLGWADLGRGIPGVPGTEHHRTPRITGFAQESLSCVRAYSAAPNCAPSRASLQTGRMTPRHGILTVGSAKRGKERYRTMEPPATSRKLRSDEVTIADLAKGAGYQTAHLGKWHLSDDPADQGYDVNVGGNASGHPKSYFSPYKNANLVDGPEGEYLTTRLTDEAIGLMESLEPPFLMHLAYYTVHTPLQAPAERIAERKEAGAKSPKYAAMVEALDAEFGRILDALEASGLASSTVVVFTSDNGGFTQVTNKEHLRGFKGTLDEGGIRVPFFVRWPDHIRPGVSVVPTHHVDLYPTIAGLTRTAVPEDHAPLDGVDLGPHWLAREKVDRSFLGWHFPVYLEGKSDRFDRWRTTPGGACLVDGRWKFLEFFQGRVTGEGAREPWYELYDLAADPRQEFNLAEKRPERMESILAQWTAWRKDVGATLPTPR